MNNVKTTKIHPGIYNLDVTTATGDRYNVKLENVKDEVETSGGFVWHIQEQAGMVDFACGAYHQTKREAIRFLKNAEGYIFA
jgi:hypothetical protein